MSKKKLASKEEIAQMIEEEMAVNIPLVKQVLGEDLFKFNKHILKVEEGENKVPLAPFHQELCDFVTDNKKKKKLILIPRGHLKSTLVTIGYATQQIVEDPSIRILIANATYRNACSFLGEIKKHLKYNDKIHELWGDLSEGAETWSRDEITLSNANTSHGKKEPTVTAMGIESNLTSQHYDMIIGDDLVNADYVNTAEQIEKTIDFYKESLNLLEPDGTLILIGTRWHDSDLYGWILNEKSVRGEFDVMIEKAYEGSLGDKESFKSLFPDKFDRRHLKRLYNNQGPYFFSCQFLNDPVPEEDADFKKEWFQYYEPADMKGALMTKFMMVDPALSLEQSADYTAMVTVGIDVHHNIYILDIFRKRVKPKELIDKLFDLWRTFQPAKIALEQVAFQKTLQYALNREMNDRNAWMPVVEVKPKNRTKEQRIRGLQPLYANKKIYHNRYIDHNQVLEDELLRFPRSKHDDVVDALSYGLDIWFPPRQKVTKPGKRKYLYG